MLPMIDFNKFQEICELFPGSIIAGGAIRNSFLGQPIDNYDLFFFEERYRYSAVNKAENELKAVDAPKRWACNRRCLIVPGIGLVKFWYHPYWSDKKSLFKYFDFTMSCAMYNPLRYVIEADKGFSESVATKTLTLLNKREITVETLMRVCRFQNDGWKLDSESMVAVLDALEGRNRDEENRLFRDDSFTP